MKLKFVLFLITIPTLYIYGQYKISGRLMHINNEKINLNSFYITDSLNENYMKIKCDSLGLFSTYTKLNKFYLVINAQNCNIYKNTHTIYSDTNFSIIYLSPKSKYLSSVLIEGKKNNIKYHSEGFEFNVANTELSNLNSLSDLLNFIPNIVVENESNLKINGKDNVAIMINGKINHIANIDIQQILKSIPPRTIKSIKVILNPDISQDANGVSSIIDIRLLSQSQGFIGNISLSNSTATDFPYFGNNKLTANISAGLGKLNLSFLIGLNRVNSINTSVSNRNLYSFIKFKSSLINDNLLFSVPLIINGNYKVTKNFQFDFTNQLIFNSKKYNIDNNVFEYFIDTTLYKIKTLGDEQKNNRTTVIQFTYNSDSSNTAIKFEILNSDFKLFDFSNFTNNIISKSVVINEYRNWNREFQNNTLKTDAEFKVNNTNKILIGLKFDYNTIIENYNKNIISNIKDTIIQSNNSYLEKILASYINYSFENKFKFDVSLGVRAEHTILNSKELGIDKSFIDLFPYIKIRYKYNEYTNAIVSFKRTLYRPKFDEIRTFVFANDISNFSNGNTTLLPSYDNNLSFDFFSKIKTINYSFGYYFQRKTEYIEPSIYSNNMGNLIFKPLNVGTLMAFCSYISFSSTFIKRLNTSFDFGFKMHLITPHSELNLSAKKINVSWFKLNSIYKMSKFTSLGVSINGNSGWDGIQRKTTPIIYSNFIIDYKIPKTSWALNLFAVDPLNINDRFDYIVGQNLSISNNIDWQSRMIGINVIYTFGNRTTKQSKIIENERIKTENE